MGVGELFDPSGFPPRWYCGEWSSLLGWVHIGSDIGTWGAYTAIPVVLGYFARRRTVPFPRVIWLFAAFILACGLTHLIEAVIFWYPVYRLSAVIKMVTAGVSLATVVALIRLAPDVVRLPAFDDLSEALRTARRDRSAAAASSRHLAAIVERSSDAIFGLGAAGEVRSLNAAAAQLLGRPAGEILGRPFAALASGPDDTATLEAATARALDAHAEARVQVTLQHAGADAREMELALAPIGGEGNPIRVAVVGRDETERNLSARQLEEANLLLEEANRTLEERVAERTDALLQTNVSLEHEVEERRLREAELRESERALETAHRIARLGAWRWWPRADRIEWSDSLYDLFGLPRGAEHPPVPVHFDELYTPESAARLTELVDRALRDGTPYRIRLEVKLGPPAPRFIEAQAQARLGEDGEVELLEGTVLDVSALEEQSRALAAVNERLEVAVEGATTELRAAVGRLEEANRDLEGFVHMASHDMQEPLRALRSYAALLEEDLGDELSSDARDDLRYIGEASRRMQRMIDALLELSRTIRKMPMVEEVDTEQLVRGLLDDLSPVIQESGAEVEVGPLAPVITDRSLLERALSNLLSNALKFAGEPPRVRISVDTDDDACRIVVEDNGHGLPAESVERAFMPFKRLPSPRKVSGTGMGLTIARRAVDMIHGRIEVSAAQLGGASLAVILPRRKVS